MKLLSFLKRLKEIKRLLYVYIPLKTELGKCGINARIEYPCFFENRKSVFLDENVSVRSGAHFINSPTEKIIIKKYSVLAANCTIITNSHRSTVSVPHFLLGESHINDKSADVVIEEDVWVGANVTIMPGVTLGRGCIVAAGAIVTKSVPPYALVAGTPAKIIAKKFFLEDVLLHENELYSQEERLSREYLEGIYDTYYKDKKTYGVSSELDEEDKIRLKAIKKKRNFVEPY